MGVYRRFLPKSGNKIVPTVEPTESIWTPANAMTAARPVLATRVAQKLVRGEKGVIIPAFFMALSDAEGNVARTFDKYLPEWHIGSSVKGAEYDPVADALALLIVSGAALAGPKVHPLGKAAVVMVLGQEGMKALWSLDANSAYKSLTGSEDNLWIPPNFGGKEAMAEKLTAVGLAASSNDFENQYIKTTLGASALGFGFVGAVRGFYHFGEYIDQYHEMMSEYDPITEQNARKLFAVSDRYERATQHFIEMVEDIPVAE